MKKTLFFGIALMGTMLLGACHSDHAHDGHDHSAEGHNHEAEGHDHEAEADGHNHEADDHGHDADDHAGHSAEITFTEAQAKAAGLRLVTVEPGEFAEVVEVTGRLLPAQGDEATVAATMAGIVSQATKSLTDGAAVRQGQQLFVINASAMADGNPAAAARAELEAARKALARAEQLAAEKLLPQRELDEARSRYRTAEAAARSLGNANQTRAVAAPFTGYMKEVLVRPGDYVQPGQPMATVTQSQRLQLSADLPERHFALLPQIQDATFRLSYEPEGTAHCVSEMGGKLVSKGKASSATGFSVPVTFELPNRGRLVSGSFAQVYLQGAARKRVITVPNEALTEAQGLFFVYVQIHPERYQRQEVTVGATDGRRTEIRSGLTAGQRVVAQGATQVRLAANATVIPEGHSH